MQEPNIAPSRVMPVVRAALTKLEAKLSEKRCQAQIRYDAENENKPKSFKPSTQSQYLRVPRIRLAEPGNQKACLQPSAWCRSQ